MAMLNLSTAVLAISTPYNGIGPAYRMAVLNMITAMLVINTPWC